MSSWSFVPRLLFLHHFCSHGNMFACSRCSYNSSTKIPVSNFHNRGKHVMGLKFATGFPCYHANSSNSLSNTPELHQDLGFSNLAFFSPPSSISSPQCGVCYLAPLALSILPPHSSTIPDSPYISLVCPICYSISEYFPLYQAPPFLFLLCLIYGTISFGLIQTSNSVCTALCYCHIFQVLLQLQLTSTVLLHGTQQYLFLLCDISFQALIWYPHFVTHSFSFYLTVLNSCVVPAAFPKFFSSNVVSCFP